MNPEEKKAAIESIRQIAGQIGAKHTLDKAPDAEEYEFQVFIGMAEAVAEVLDHKEGSFSHWLGFLILATGLPSDPRLDALIDALENEIELQWDKVLEESDDAADD